MTYSLSLRPLTGRAIVSGPAVRVKVKTPKTRFYTEVANEVEIEGFKVQ